MDVCFASVPMLTIWYQCSLCVCSQIKILIENPEEWATILGQAFPDSANFFLNYVIASEWVPHSTWDTWCHIATI